jgi:uncharacterized membrane protein YccC
LWPRSHPPIISREIITAPFGADHFISIFGFLSVILISARLSVIPKLGTLSSNDKTALIGGSFRLTVLTMGFTVLTTSLLPTPFLVTFAVIGFTVLITSRLPTPFRSALPVMGLTVLITSLRPRPLRVALAVMGFTTLVTVRCPIWGVQV